MTDLAQQAINCALKSDWEAAKSANLQILKSTKNDISALNRLAKAYSELGNTKKAIQTAKKIIAIDPYNKIAVKSLAKWQQAKGVASLKSGPFSAKEFIEEPGKTKIVSLVHVGGAGVLAGLDSGDEVRLDAHGHRITVSTQDGKYVGRLPDDLSRRLKTLIGHGNIYKALVKSIDKTDVRIFLKETSRAEKIKDVPSFSTERIDYISFTPPGLVHKSKLDNEVLDSDEEL